MANQKYSRFPLQEMWTHNLSVSWVLEKKIPHLQGNGLSNMPKRIKQVGGFFQRIPASTLEAFSLGIHSIAPFFSMEDFLGAKPRKEWKTDTATSIHSLSGF
jgi:hypothetical protein